MSEPFLGEIIMFAGNLHHVVGLFVMVNCCPFRTIKRSFRFWGLPTVVTGERASRFPIYAVEPPFMQDKAMV